MSDDTIVVEHPELGGYHATVEVLDRINAPELRVRRMRELLLEHGLVRPGDEDRLGPLDRSRRTGDLCGSRPEMAGYDPLYRVRVSPKYLLAPRSQE